MHLLFLLIKKIQKEQPNQILEELLKLILPKSNILIFQLKNELKTLWKLSNIDFLFIIKSWPFIMYCY